MKKRTIALAMVMILNGSMLGGCGLLKHLEKKDTINNIPFNEQEETEKDDKKEITGEEKYAVILKTQASDFWVKMKKGIEEKADAMGVEVDIYAAQSEEDFEGQLLLFENCLDKGYDGIAVAPLSSTNLIPGVVRATELGIPIINIDEKIDKDELTQQGGAVVRFVATDNIELGRKAATFIAERIEEGTQVAIIEGMAENQSGRDRTQGATEVFKEAGFEVCASAPADWDREKAMEMAASIIEQNADLKAIYCCNDTMALGALQAVINADKLGEILVVGTDGDEEAIDSVNAGRLTATVAQDAVGLGAKSTELLVQAVTRGEKGTIGKIPEVTSVETTIIY